jgi:hypothetical protein
MSHLRAADGTVICDHPEPHPLDHATDHGHEHDGHEHEHSHGPVDRTILRSRAGVRAVSWSLAILTVTALAQAFIYTRTLSIALLADLIHNFGDALTAIPLGLAFFVRSLRGEKLAGLAVVLAIFTAPSLRSDKRSSASLTRAPSPTSGCSPLPASSASSASNSPLRSVYAPAATCKAPPL